MLPIRSMPTLLASFDRQFQAIDHRSRDLLELIPDSILFKPPRERADAMFQGSGGEYLIRSAAVVEQTFGGITTKLWDDPFEWTLPEKLFDTPHILAYFDEVEATRQAGFGFFTSDRDLERQIPAPQQLTSLFDLLLETVASAEHYQGRAAAVFQILTGQKLPRR